VFQESGFLKLDRVSAKRRSTKRTFSHATTGAESVKLEDAVPVVKNWFYRQSGRSLVVWHLDFWHQHIYGISKAPVSAKALCQCSPLRSLPHSDTKQISYQPRPTRLKIAKQQQQNQQQGPLLRIQLPQGQARRQRKRSWQVRLLLEG
jgi:hypothetical protein